MQRQFTCRFTAAPRHFRNIPQHKTMKVSCKTSFFVSLFHFLSLFRLYTLLAQTPSYKLYSAVTLQFRLLTAYNNKCECIYLIAVGGYQRLKNVNYCKCDPNARLDWRLSAGFALVRGGERGERGADLFRMRANGGDSAEMARLHTKWYLLN